MQLRVDPNSTVPPSQQLVAAVLDAIARGELRPGDKLPAVRALAAQVLVNPNTVGKAWRDLLKNPDAALGIDTEFTRPGIEALLGQLETDFEQCEPTSEFEFKWH